MNSVKREISNWISNWIVLLREGVGLRSSSIVLWNCAEMRMALEKGSNINFGRLTLELHCCGHIERTQEERLSEEVPATSHEKNATTKNIHGIEVVWLVSSFIWQCYDMERGFDSQCSRQGRCLTVRCMLLCRLVSCSLQRQMGSRTVSIERVVVFAYTSNIQCN